MRNGEGEALQSLKNPAGKVLRGRAHMSEAGRPCENGMRRRRADLDHGQLKRRLRYLDHVTRSLCRIQLGLWALLL